jgi:hypothetical protein
VVASVCREAYGGHLTPADLELAVRVTGDHADELMATVRETVAAARADAPPPHPGPRWLNRLAEVSVPVVVGSRRFRGHREAIA